MFRVALTCSVCLPSEHTPAAPAEEAKCLCFNLLVTESGRSSCLFYAHRERVPGSHTQLPSSPSPPPVYLNFWLKTLQTEIQHSLLETFHSSLTTKDDR